MTGDELRAVFSKKIKFFRNSRGWSQAVLAEKANISITFLSDIERGNKWPHPDTLTSLARALGVDVYEFFREANAAKDAEHDFTAKVLREILVAMNHAADSVSRQYLTE
ncbi:MAG: helix-turn-helix domain-containing protein [Treponema sp.]|jgi:transcriptional regulator with XRE-family HTH domain|nr:helix-turn-helix domain-containing protein [Treponema sp.]